MRAPGHRRALPARGENGPAAAETPRYGGVLDVGTVYVTLSALSWDPVDWAWKSNHDYGMVREQLFAGDLDKSVRKGGHYPFVAEAYLPNDVLRGELAERWEWEDEHTLVVHLRPGPRFSGRAGVMEARELTAADVVYTFHLVNDSPKKAQSDYWGYIDGVEARDDRTVVFRFNEFNAEWPYRFGYGYQSSIVPREMANVDPKSWRNVVGTGPFLLERYIHGNSHTYVRNADYWDRERLAGESWPIRVRGCGEVPRHQGRGDLPHGDPHRQDRHPRSRPLDRRRPSQGDDAGTEVVEVARDGRQLRGDADGHASLRRCPGAAGAQSRRRPARDRGTLLRGPRGSDGLSAASGIRRVLAAPRGDAAVRTGELFDYQPEKARALLDEAGVPEGFTFKVQVCTCTASNMDLVPLLDAYLAKVGVRMEIEPMEYASFLSMMTTLNHGPGGTS